MSTPTEYRLLKERHEALRAAVSDLAARTFAYAMDDRMTAMNIPSDELDRKAYPWGCEDSGNEIAAELRALLEGDTR